MEPWALLENAFAVIFLITLTSLSSKSFFKTLNINKTSFLNDIHISSLFNEYTILTLPLLQLALHYKDTGGR